MASAAGDGRTKGVGATAAEAQSEAGLQRVLSVLEALFRLTGDTRYRASFALRTAAQDEPAAHAENVVYLPV